MRSPACSAGARWLSIAQAGQVTASGSADQIHFVRSGRRQQGWSSFSSTKWTITMT